MQIGLDEGCGPLGVKSLIDGCHNLVELLVQPSFSLSSVPVKRN